MLASIVRIHWRHGCPICSVAPRSQAPKPHRGAPKARGFTARARTELPSIRRQTDGCIFYPQSLPFLRAGIPRLNQPWDLNLL